MNLFTTRSITKSLSVLRLTLIATASVLVISACGQKGPLKLPEDAAKPAANSHNHADK